MIVGNDAALFERIDAIAYPGLTANFDAGKTAALALGLLDWKEHGPAYAQAMQATARALAKALAEREGLPVFARERGGTSSHALAIEAARWGGGQAAAKRLEGARLLACGIGLPHAVAAVRGRRQRPAPGRAGDRAPGPGPGRDARAGGTDRARPAQRGPTRRPRRTR